MIVMSSASKCFCMIYLSIFFFKVPATTEIYTLSLHDALPICLFCEVNVTSDESVDAGFASARTAHGQERILVNRSEEHTSELQSRENLVCRLLLEKKKTRRNTLDFYRKEVAGN